jgi:hypothetical protein
MGTDAMDRDDAVNLLYISSMYEYEEETYSMIWA